MILINRKLKQTPLTNQKNFLLWIIQDNSTTGLFQILKSNIRYLSSLIVIYSLVIDKAITLKLL